MTTKVLPRINISDQIQWSGVLKFNRFFFERFCSVVLTLRALFSTYLNPQADACDYMLCPVSRLLTKRAKLKFLEEKFAYRVKM